MRDLLDEYERLAAGGDQVGRAVVASVWGSAPRPEGSSLLATADGRFAGSISGGCVETSAVQEVGAVLMVGTPRLVTYGVTNERAWEVGLACGGTIRVFVEPMVSGLALRAARAPEGSVVATVIGTGPEGTGGAEHLIGRSVMVLEDGTCEGREEDRWLGISSRQEAMDALARERSAAVILATPAGMPVEVLLEVYPRLPKLLIFGATLVAQAMVPMAKALGYFTCVADGREAFLVPERFPQADRLLTAWPAEAFREVGLDRGTCVCVLSHDPKFDEPALDIALRSSARYVGAIGSRQTQAARRDRLRHAGFTEEEIGRLRGPIGLDLGGRSAAETALAILAEMT
ncbi:MAG: XdhC family protein, partial [Gemmatimonadota bacterium]|nr:XdhC family protein [Gemmatimonadota bacterium]